MRITATFFLLTLPILSFATQFKATVNSTTNIEPFGSIVFTDSPYGLLIIPDLKDLKPGPHGFHFHSHASCDHEGKDAGAHFDPKKTNMHKGPYAEGHLGDLPVLFVNEDGTATTPILAPRLKATDINGLAIIIHDKGDNYSDNPPLGGGGDRIGCGVVAEIR